MPEALIVTALPHSAHTTAPADPRDHFHVSLFLTLRLTPTARRGLDPATLAEFPHAAVWTQTIAGAEIELFGMPKGASQPVPIAVTPLLNALRPSLWTGLFPGDTKVRHWNRETYKPEDVRSYSADDVDVHVFDVHAMAIQEGPLHFPALRGTYFESVAMAALAGHDLQAGTLTLDRLLDNVAEIDALLSRDLDQRLTAPGTGGLTQPGQAVPGVGQLTPGSGVTLPRGGMFRTRGRFDSVPLDEGPEPGVRARIRREVVPASIVAPGGIADGMLNMHAAHRYYEVEPEAPEQPPPPPDLDFHDRCALISGLPTLLRWLGLVVDLRVNDPKDLTGLTWIQGRVLIEDIDQPYDGKTGVLTPRTSCYVRGTGFFTKPATDDWRDGALRLGDEDLFAVPDLEPDGSALKLNGYMRSLPRLLAAETNGDPVTAAPPALRADGFSIVRRRRRQALLDHLKRADDHAKALEKGKGEPLSLEEVTSGVRLEVWDDVSKAWHSLHERELDIGVRAGGTVEPLGTVQDPGYLQGASLAKWHGIEDFRLHEVIASWGGWSLSASPPGRTILSDDVVGDPHDGGTPSPVEIASRVKPGSLPRLRYGRSYSFRALAVDPAGNSRPHPLGPAGPIPPDVPGLLAPFIEAMAGAVKARIFQEHAVTELRTFHPRAAAGPSERRVEGLDPRETVITGDPDLDGLILRNIVAGLHRSGFLTRHERIEREFVEALHEADRLYIPTVTVPHVEVASGLYWGLAEGILGELSPELVVDYADLATVPKPFLRWDPVLPPAAVPRNAYTDGESLLTMVIRSGVDVGESGEPTIDLPRAYADAHPAAGWHDTSERHLAAPKTSQREAELHGEFDFAIGSSDPDDHRRALAIALRESGTLLDTTVGDLEDPGGRVDQDEMELAHGPMAEMPDPLPTLGSLERGEPLPAGWYVVHGAEQLLLPYLPDPLAAGISLVFPDAGRDHRLTFPWSVEGLRLDWSGDWPELQPYRLVLAWDETDEHLSGRVEGNEIRIAVPPGEQLRVRVSSALRAEELNLLGLWRQRPEEYRERTEIREAAADGWMWWLTPADEFRLVHAVPRPVQAPRIVKLEVSRSQDGTDVELIGALDVHGPSTGRIDLESSWTETVDDLTADAPAFGVPERASPFGAQLDYAEDLVVLAPAVFQLTGLAKQLPPIRQAVHAFGDTKHRVVEYRARGTTRYREHFDLSVSPTIEDISLAGPGYRVSIPSSARPPEPVVRDVLPLFRWAEETEPDQPFGLRRTRRAGLRVYLERPWDVTGEGELLAVVLGPVYDKDEKALTPKALSAVSVSQWAADPVWSQNGPANAAWLPLLDTVHILGFDDRLEPGRPVRPLERRPLVDVKGQVTAQVLGYRPEYNPNRKLWFADVVFNQRTAFWPFVRLAVARYQPESLEGLHLSPVVTCDFAQLAPDRIATVTRPDPNRVRVVVTGPVGFPKDVARVVHGILRPGPEEAVILSRTVRARLERTDAVIGTDLGWETTATVDLTLRGLDDTTATWLGELTLPEELPPRRPGSDPGWRVTIEEWERLQADPPSTASTPQEWFRTEPRLVYADHMPL